MLNKILHMAWRNIWRNKRRSQIILLSVIIGVITIIMFDSLSRGMVEQMLNNTLNSHVTHVQIVAKDYHSNPVIARTMIASDTVERLLTDLTGLKRFTPRLELEGLASSPRNSSGTILVGIDPKRERPITIIESFITEGRYIDGTQREIMIGKRLAERLEVSLGEKVILMSSRLDGSIGSDAFRIAAIFDTPDPSIDQRHIYLPIEFLGGMLNARERVSHYCIEAENRFLVDDMKLELQALLPSRFEVHSYRDLVPMVVMQVDSFDQMMFFFYLIFGIGIVFGIVNTMLMSVFERIPEFGVLMSVGMRNTLVFYMIMLEAFLLTALGTVIGIVSGVALVFPFVISGIDFSAFSSALEGLGVSVVIHPVISLNVIVISLVMMTGFGLLGALYPAAKAARLQPVEALRHT